MKTRLWFAVIGFLPGFGLAQSSVQFQNLDFEMAIPPATPSGIHSGAQDFYKALPHWQGMVAAAPANLAGYNTIPLDYPGIGLYDSNVLSYGGQPLGQYAAVLANSPIYNLPGFPVLPTQLSQTGLIPTGTKSLWFYTSLWQGFNPALQPADWRLSLSVNGQELATYSEVSDQPGWGRWAADVSGLGGATSEIRFSLMTGLVPNAGHVVGVAVGLDNITFSPEIVPEPNLWCLAVLGPWLLLRRRSGDNGCPGSDGREPPRQLQRRPHHAEVIAQVQRARRLDA